MNYILYEDGSKEPIVNYNIIDGHLCGVYAPSGYYTFYEVINQHPETRLYYKVPVFEKRVVYEDDYGTHWGYIRVNNIKEIAIEFTNNERNGWEEVK